MYATRAVLADKIVLSAAMCTSPAQLYGDILHKWTKLSCDGCLLACAWVVVPRWHLWCVYSILSPIMDCKRMCHICISPFKVLSTVLWQEVWMKLVEMGIWLASLNLPFSGLLKHRKQVFVKPHVFTSFIFKFQMPSSTVLYQNNMIQTGQIWPFPSSFFLLRGGGHVFPAAPGPGGGGGPACDVTMHYTRLPWRCPVDQRWLGAGSWQRPLR